MSFKDLKITEYRDSVYTLPDYPSDAGITATQLKAVFDSRTDNEIKEKFNKLIDRLITKFGSVEIDIADAVEDHNQHEDAHERIITPIKTSIEDILLELRSMNTSIDGKADGLETANQLGALDLIITGTTNELQNHTGARDNPHNVTKAQVGLDKVDNTPDNEKEVAFASSAEMDSLGNSIHEHYATKDEVGNVDLSGYYTKTESDKKFVGNDAYNEGFGSLDGAIAFNSDRIDQLAEDVGKIDTALDELHSYAQNLVGGDA